MTQKILDFTAVTFLVLAASLTGILTRPLGELALFWPANAVLIGILCRFPRLIKPSTVVAAIFGYLAADLLMGNSLHNSVGLTIANLTGVGIGIALLMRLSLKDRLLQRPEGVAYVFVISLVVSLSSALIGCFAIESPNPYFSRVASWVSNDMISIIVVLPLLLTMPFSYKEVKVIRSFARRQGDVVKALPCIALVFSMLLAMFIKGPGAMAIPLPAILWCASIYSIPTVAALTTVLCLWWVYIFSGCDVTLLTSSKWVEAGTSIRLGICLTALSPLMVVSLNHANKSLINKLHHAVSYDALTKVLSRRGFIQSVSPMLTIIDKTAPRWFTIMILDLDHFKSLNSQYGHFAGDQTLVYMGDLLTKLLRPDDLIGRFGGEEFAVAYRTASQEDAQNVAMRILRESKQTEISAGGIASIPFTCSIGLSETVELPTKATLEDMLIDADRSLYHAKTNGRKQLAFFANDAYQLRS